MSTSIGAIKGQRLIFTSFNGGRACGPRVNSWSRISSSDCSSSGVRSCAKSTTMTEFVFVGCLSPKPLARLRTVRADSCRLHARASGRRRVQASRARRVCCEAQNSSQIASAAAALSNAPLRWSHAHLPMRREHCYAQYHSPWSVPRTSKPAIHRRLAANEYLRAAKPLLL